MTPEQFVRLQSLFEDALQRPTAERRVWAEAQCRGEPSLREALFRLLDADASGSDRLEKSLIDGVSGAAQSLLDEGAASGDQVGRYRLLREIGRGGMGRVFEAEFDEAGVRQRVAIKLLRRDALSPSTRSRFLRERRLLASLVHPGIARLRDIGETASGEPYLVMELAHGVPITQWCAERRLGIRDRLELFRQVLAAASHAHRQLIIHRDLKPGNVLVDDQGQVKLLDFGIAKALDGNEAETQAHERMLTPMYAAPEQLLDAPTGVACDVYSLGVMLYELVTGSVPHPRDDLTLAEFERRVTLVPPPPLAKTVAQRPSALEAAGLGPVARWKRECPDDLDALVQRALHKSPEERFASVDQFEEDIRNLLEDRPIRARGGGFGYRFRCFVRRHRAMVAAGTLAGTLLVAGGVAFVRQAEQTARERDRARAAVEILQQAFQSADPFQMGGEVATARGILRGAGERLLARLEEDPETYAPIALDLVETQFSLGLIADDAEWIDQVLQHPAALRLDAGERAAALGVRFAILREDRHAARQRLDRYRAEWPGSERMALLEAQIALLEQSPEQAVDVLIRRTGLHDEAFRRAATDEPEALWQLADALQASARVPEAIELLERLLGVQSAGLGQDHPRVLVTRLRLADLHRANGDNALALDELDTMALSVAAAFGPRSAIAGLLKATRARVLASLRRHVEASEAFLDAEAIYAASFGPGHRNTIKVGFNAAQLLVWAPESRARGLEEFRRIDTLARQSFEADDPLLEFIGVEHAAALRVAGRRESARQVLLSMPQASSRGDTASSLWAKGVRELLSEPEGCSSPAMGTSGGDTARRLKAAICSDEGAI